MMIAIRSINSIRSLELAPKDIHRYWIEFDSALVSGEATLYSRKNAKTLMLNRTISVETEQDSIEYFKKLPNYYPTHYLLLSQAKPGNFAAMGQVNSVIRFGKNMEQAIIDIFIGPCRFSLTNEDIADNNLNKGDWVQFKIIGLSFWDEHT